VGQGKHLVAILFTALMLLTLILFPACQATPGPKVAPPNNSVTGHVYNDGNNSPLANVTITIIDNNNRNLKNSVTDGRGRYLITDIPAGDYLVTAKADGYRVELYNGADGEYRAPADKVNKVTINEDQATTGIDFRMKELASISGRVYRADNKRPVENARLSIYGLHWSFGPISSVTVADGSYKVTRLNSSDNTLGCEAKGYVTQYYPGVYDSLKSKKVTTTYGLDTPNIDFNLDWGGSISGMVYEPDGTTPTIKVTKPGNEFKEATVFFYQISGIKTPVLGGDLPTPSTSSTKVNPDGSYLIDGLLTGEYDLMIVTRSAKGVLTTAHTIVSVIIGQETQGIDFVTLLGGSVSGHVYLEDGVTPANGLSLTANIDPGYPLGGYSYAGGSSAVSSDGSYSLELLPPGKVTLSISGNTSYAGKQYSIIVVSGQNSIFDIVLSRN